MRKYINPEYGKHHTKFQFYVAWVDQNSTIRDEQQIPTLSKVSPQTGRNLHIGGFRLNGQGGGITLNVIVPQEVLGSFKMPQIGDVVWIEEDKSYPGAIATYLYSVYNNVPPGKRHGSNPVPQWGSMAGDYGHVRTHRDHNRQFTGTVDTNFVRKYIRSITGYRFRSFYESNLKEGKFVVRGDPVFDINPELNDPEYVIEDGVDLGYGGTITKPEHHEYPNPLNVPEEREEDEDYTYVKTVYEPIDFEVELDPYKFESRSKKSAPRKIKKVNKNKNYMSYQPIMDKTYLEDVDFERELPAAEEYQVSLRGNNKLLIQDQSGDGEQLVITLKSQYDEGFTVIHNGDKGQVRVRDHLGQGVLLEANPEHPRVMSWTSARQTMVQGHIPDDGAYTYIRNGDVYGDSDTEFGTKTGLQKSGVSNQEFLLTSSPTIAGSIADTLSAGMRNLAVAKAAAGIFMRNNTDPDDSEQTYALYNTKDSLVSETEQLYQGYNGYAERSLRRQSLFGDRVHDEMEVRHDSPGASTFIVEDRIAAGDSVQRTYELNYDNKDILIETESSTGGSTLQRTTDMTAENTNRTVTIHDAGGGSIVQDVYIEGVLTNKIAMDGDSNRLERYSGVDLVSLVSLTDDTITIDSDNVNIVGNTNFTP